MRNGETAALFYSNKTFFTDMIQEYVTGNEAYDPMNQNRTASYKFLVQPVHFNPDVSRYASKKASSFIVWFLLYSIFEYTYIYIYISAH